MDLPKPRRIRVDSAFDLRIGFTIVELLVVIAIISVLAGLLLPALSQAKGKAYSALCKANLKQQSLGLSLYVGDSGCYPFGWGSRLDTSEDRVSWADSEWWQDILPYVGGQLEIFYCPANPGKFRLTNSPPLLTLPGGPTGYDGHQGRSYGYNVFGTKSPVPDLAILGLGHMPHFDSTTGILTNRVSENMVAAPADMIAIGDSHSDFTNDSSISMTVSMLPGRRHQKGANIVFCDGHVEWQRQRNWVARTPEARLRWNRDHQPHPETWTETLDGIQIVPPD